MMALDRRGFLSMGALAGLMAARRGAAQPQSSITVAISRDIQGALDPADRLSAVEGNIIRAVCPGLIAFKPGTFEWQTAAAARIAQISPTEIAFDLRPGQKFSDGFGELTADDVKFSFERFREPGPSGKPFTQIKDWEALDHVEVTGPLSGRILLKVPAPALWSVVLPDVSGCLISRKAAEAGAYRAAEPPIRLIGAGPYLLAEWSPGQRLVLRENPAFSGEKPAFSEVVLRPVRDPKTAELSLRAGEITFAAIEPSAMEGLARVPHTKVSALDSINFVWLGLNVEKKPFDDVRVRQAIRLAIDVDQVLLGGYDGAVSRAYGPVAPGLLGNWARAPHYRPDPEKARAMLVDAGYGAGFKARLTLLNQPRYEAAAQVIQAFLGTVGIEIELETLDAGSYWSSGSGERGKALDLCLQRFGGKADPAFQMQWFTPDQVGTWNWQRWRSADYDKLFTQAASSSDPAERQRLYEQMQQLMDESAAFIWLTHERNTFGYRDWLSPALLPNGDDLLFDRFSRA